MSFDILVCLDGHPKSHLLVDAGRRQARETGKRWAVLYMGAALDDLEAYYDRVRLLTLLDDARASGAEIVHLERPDANEATMAYLQSCFGSDEGIHHIIVGQRAGRGFLGRSLADRIVRRYGRVAQVTLVPLEGQRFGSSVLSRLQLGSISWRTFAGPVLAVACAVMAAEALRSMLPMILYKINNHNIALIFLLACVIVALRQGLWAALVASALSSLVINYAYVIPIFRFNIGSLTDIINITIFVVAALTVSVLGGQVRAGIDTARVRERRSRALYDMARLTADADTSHQALEILDRELHRLFGLDIAFFLPKDDGEMPDFQSYPSGTILSDEESNRLKRVWAGGDLSAVRFSRLRSPWRFELMCTASRKYGVFAVNVPLKTRLDVSFAPLMSAVADQVAATLERLELSRDMVESRFREEREKLRSMLLSSVSHDLKTPLASIIGSLSVIRSLGDTGRLSAHQSDELVDTALVEAQRLESFITNILSMTRIESGAVEFSISPHDPADLIGHISKAMRVRLNGRAINLVNAHEGAVAMMDGQMTAQVLQNVLDNAAKYSPDGTPIDVTLARVDGHFEYRIRDHGPGIPDGQFEKVFDKYERLNKTDSQVAGTGLGLAIAKSVMQAQGGDIVAANHPEGGAEFILSFPLADANRDLH